VPERYRVVDVSQGWAGPMVGYMLSLFGAEVFKVESARYFDWWRGSPHPDALPGDQRHEMSPTHNSVNRNKLGVTIDLAMPEGKALLHELLAVSDAFVENYPPNVMPGLGFAPAEVVARHPRLVMLSMPALGSTGPDALYRGFGTTVDAMAGIALSQGYADGPPLLTPNAYGDPTSGLTGAFAVLAALRERERTGKGRHIELSELEATIPHGSERLLEWPAMGVNPARWGSRRPEMAPHGSYPSLPAENGARWVVISCRDDTDWAALRKALGGPEWARDPRFATLGGRLAAQDAIDAGLGAWTSVRTHREAMETLQSFGVPAGAALSSSEVLYDPHLQERGFNVPVSHPVMGAALYPGAVIRMSKTPPSALRPAPLLGEHTDHVLREILGKSDTEIEALRATGVLDNEPRRKG
jgi:crotonobetainyl-CoA:carnitine CoA-transferase CaiB-like acyl-CoA transferase